MTNSRSSGVLCHITSLPGAFGVGDLGPSARRFVDWLASARQGYWQILPLSPPGAENSPYSGRSAFANNPVLISPEDLITDALLAPSDLLDVGSAPLPDHTVAYERAVGLKDEFLAIAFENFERARHGGGHPLNEAFVGFRDEESAWIDDYCLLLALSEEHGSDWREWPTRLRTREEKAIEGARSDNARRIDFHAFCQFLFRRQWDRLHRYANERGIRIIGDAPIFVTADSVDVWTDPDSFHLDDELNPIEVAGVPPDYFSEDGQLWGHPLYDWESLKKSGYRFWVNRLRSLLKLVDLIRIDHFRGFESYWAVPFGKKTAVEGTWRKAPGEDLFRTVKLEIDNLAVIAEDLGRITPDVVKLRKKLGLPGMAVLQFGFIPSEGETHLAHFLERDKVVYTGTHDNNTTLGWFLEDIDESTRHQVRQYVQSDGREIHWDIIRLAWASVADLAIVPVQDLEGLGSDCRMNTPGIEKGQWRFRLVPWMLGDKARDRLRILTETYGRAP